MHVTKTSLYGKAMKIMEEKQISTPKGSQNRAHFSMRHSFRVGWGKGRIFAVRARVGRKMKTPVALRSVHRKEQNGTDRYVSILRV